MTSMETLTIGVAIPVPEPLGSAVARTRAAVGDAAASIVPTHVTLVPPTRIEADEFDAIVAHLREVASRTAAFDLVLEGTETFLPVTEVAYVRVQAGGDECDRLQLDLRDGPLVRELDYPYHPHVTLAQNVERSALTRARELIGHVSMRVDVEAFTLYVERSGQPWVALDEFSFGG